MKNVNELLKDIARLKSNEIFIKRIFCLQEQVRMN